MSHVRQGCLWPVRPWEKRTWTKNGGKIEIGRMDDRGALPSLPKTANSRFFPSIIRYALLFLSTFSQASYSPPDHPPSRPKIPFLVFFPSIIRYISAWFYTPVPDVTYLLYHISLFFSSASFIRRKHSRSFFPSRIRYLPVIPLNLSNSHPKARTARHQLLSSHKQTIPAFR